MRIDKRKVYRRYSSKACSDCTTTHTVRAKALVSQSSGPPCRQIASRSARLKLQFHKFEWLPMRHITSTTRTRTMTMSAVLSRKCKDKILVSHLLLLLMLLSHHFLLHQAGGTLSCFSFSPTLFITRRGCDASSSSPLPPSLDQLLHFHHPQHLRVLSRCVCRVCTSAKTPRSDNYSPSICDPRSGNSSHRNTILRFLTFHFTTSQLYLHYPSLFFLYRALLRSPGFSSKPASATFAFSLP